MGRTFAEYVRARREEHRLSLRVLASRTGISKSALHAWERNLQRPSLPELDALLAVYGANPEERADVLNLIDAPRAHRELRRFRTETVGLPPPVNGDILRALRVRRGLSVSGAARVLQVPASTVLRWERGEFWPTNERLELICSSFRAAPAERAALLAEGEIGPIRSTADRESIARMLWELDQWSGIGEPMPFLELQLVNVAADLWPMIGRWTPAEALYRETNAFLGKWALVAHGALDDAAIYSRRALAGDGGQVVRTTISWPAHILAKQAAYGARRHRPSDGVALLKRYGERYAGDLGLLAWYQRDLAEFYAEAGDLGAALELSTEASATTRRAGDPTENADFDHARLLIRARRFEEAIELLPPMRSSVPLAEASEAITWTEVLLETGEPVGAARALERAQTIVATWGLATLVPRVEALAERIGG